MVDPFKIAGPALISFSGGRTSALMLRRCIDAGLDPDVCVTFANTGKERPETLDFVHEVATRWGVPIVWLERDIEAGFRVVSFATAARDGGPMAELIEQRRFLPNPVTRFCTTELKIRVMKRYMLSLGHEYWTNVVGLRADEPRRVSNMRAKDGKERWTVAMPLAEAGLTLADVDAFWRAQPFDLRLRSWEGNCDLCFLKGRAKRERIVRDQPALADWWIGMEDKIGSQFRLRDATYRQLVASASRPMLFDESELEGAIDDLGDCVCNA